MKINLATLAVTSNAFGHGGRIPDDHSSNGVGVSPDLSWSGVPEGTSSFAVVVHDPDAPLVRGFTHWVLYGIPADVHELAVGGGEEYTSGVNGMGATGWAPVAPPPGHGDHFYYFNVYAIGGDVSLEPGLSADEVLDRIDDHIIAQARLVGTYRND